MSYYNNSSFYLEHTVDGYGWGNLNHWALRSFLQKSGQHHYSGHTGIYSNLPAPSVFALKIRGPRFMPNQSHTVILLLCFLLPRQPSNFPHFPQSMTSMNHQDCFTEHQSCRMMFRDDVSPSLEAMELLIV